MTNTYIIAEAGVNHNGSLELASQMIHCAKEMGADAVKFQLFNADSLTTFNAEQADYQKKNTKIQVSQYEMLKALELSMDHFRALSQIASLEGIDCIITPFDLDSLNFIVQELNLPIIKIGSGDITNGPLLLNAARCHKNIILSTGMCTLGDIENALGVIALGMLDDRCAPTMENIKEAYSSVLAQDLLQEKVSLLHCTSEYPAPMRQTNLRAMDTLKSAFGLKTGLSDHTPGIEVSIASVAREACIIEKHFTLDKNLPGPDHLASLDISEFTSMVKAIRNIELALGHGRKFPMECEKKNATLVRRSLVANRAIKKGEVFTAQNLAIKRPQAGLSPMHYWDRLGKSAEKDYQKDEAIA